MDNYKIYINNNQFEFDKQISIKEACINVGINIPTIYLTDDIDFVEVNESLVNSSTLIEDEMNIYTESELVSNFVENKIKELHAKLSVSCDSCSVSNCPLKEQFNKFHLSDNGSTYKECTYYQNGVLSNVLVEEESHIGLEEMLTNKNIHKVAIIDYEMKPKMAEILNKGFNEVITSDFVKKFKIIEESALILKEIAKSLDKRENLLPVYILEDLSLKHLVKKEFHKNIINVGSIVELTNKIFKVSLEADKIFFVYITQDKFNNESIQEITFDYLMTLPNIESAEINNISKQLKLDDKEINYNSFVNYLIDIFNSKQKFIEDIYNLSDYEIKLKGKTVKISNIRYSNCDGSDIVLVLENKQCHNTSSMLNDNDVNYVYKNFIKKPGEL